MNGPGAMVRFGASKLSRVEGIGLVRRQRDSEFSASRRQENRAGLAWPGCDTGGVVANLKVQCGCTGG